MAEVLQIEVGGFENNYAYLVYDSQKTAFLIDATGSAEKIQQAIDEKGLRVAVQASTHSHFDHVENISYFEKKGIPHIPFEKLQKEPGFMVGGMLVRVIFTPGHSKDSVCFLIGNNLFTGDTLFAKGTGRTDLEGGSEKEMAGSLAELSKLPSALKVWPGHNYGGSSAKLGEALSNSGVKPKKGELERIDKKREEYENNSESDEED